MCRDFHMQCYYIQQEYPFSQLFSKSQSVFKIIVFTNNNARYVLVVACGNYRCCSWNRPPVDFTKTPFSRLFI